MNKKEEGIYQNTHEADLTALSNFEHLQKALKNHFVKFTSITFGFFLTTVAVLELFIYPSYNLPEIELNIALLIISILISSIIVWLTYIKTEPQGFENEDDDIQKVVHLKKPQWEYVLAKKLLTNRLNQIDEKLTDLTSGRTYVATKKSPTEQEYWEWVNLRIKNLEKLSSPIIQLMVYDFPESLGIKGGEASELKILNTVEKINLIYNELYKFELEGYQIEPPDFFKNLHQYQYDWTLVLQDGIKQIHTFLDKVITHDFKAYKHLTFSFNIVIGAPKNLDNFVDELNRLEKQL